MNKLNCVLLVDDNETTCFINRLLLDKLNIVQELLTARDGRAALNLLQERLNTGEQLPELILLDIKMPGMDGFEFFAEYKQRPEFSFSLIVMLTTSQNTRDLEQAKGLGIPYYLTKPLTSQKISDIVDQHFKLKQSNTL
ncbi:response regulator [Adhaeribacter radiodurans]|uniref:Response regulator n=1 Tax=Adhaeribacter radiodurans TaxID=2745197 RepID=A0A7L7L6W8_9BACT|nr:response regulator [Adhaeribacter radiodurans]QMU28550.1 response regulator [Adhaeribacter radiodurans]